jgi:nucleoside-diphosphate-sugar epimerase
MKSRVLVLGGSSPVGTRAIKLLEERGRSVSAVTRTARPSLRLANGEWIQVDLDQSGTQLDLSGYSTVISAIPIDLAARALLRSPSGNVRRCVAISSTSVSTKRNANNSSDRELAIRLHEGERTIKDLFPEVTVLRPTMIYFGSGDRNVERIVNHLRRIPIFPLVGGGTGLRQPIHADDVAQAVVQASLREFLPRGTYNIGGGEVLSVKNLVRRVASTQGLGVYFVSIPLPLARAGLASVSWLPRFREIPFGALDRMRQDMVFNIEYARQDFGFTPRAFQPTHYQT